jgi:hypothetical protein
MDSIRGETNGAVCVGYAVVLLVCGRAVAKL